jgi:hypothetical protein
MESVIKFSVDNLELACALNQFGRRRYGSLDNLLMTAGVKSTVGSQDEINVLMEDKRLSTSYKRVCTFTFEKQGLIDALAQLVPEDRRLFVKWFPDNHTYTIISYDVGGFFVPHNDNKVHKQHYGTLLIFPPATGDLAHSGGELIITKEDGTEFVFDSSKNTQWTFVAFHQHLLHECKPVTSGHRVVIKTELMFSSAKALANHDTRDDIIYDFPLIDGSMRHF